MFNQYLCLLGFILAPSIAGFAQVYFPPLIGEQWDQLDPAALDWCPERIDSLHAFLEENNTKAFMILKDGLIVDEHYFGSYTQDSIWYWASSGKSLLSMLIGCAQGDSLLSIEDRTSDHLGEGWTNAPADKEELIKIKHHLSMSTGLDYNTPDQNCMEPYCLNYLTDPDQEWYYYNATYGLLQDVLVSATATDLNLHTFQRIGSRIGMGGFWFDNTRYGKARDMARFGLLAFNNGIWEQDTVLTDAQYHMDMIQNSQDFNDAYGYLWWLNGSSTYMLPQVELTIPGGIITNAPEDMYAALGKNDQKIYIVPSQGLVVVRQGNAAEGSFFGPSSFDNALWEMIGQLECAPDRIEETDLSNYSVYPNPVQDVLKVEGLTKKFSISIHDIGGRLLLASSNVGEIDMSTLKSGMYMLTIKIEGREIIHRLIKE